MMQSHPMKDALKRRMAKGLDITITVGTPEGKKAESDLAPPGDHMDVDDVSGKPPINPMHPDADPMQMDPEEDAALNDHMMSDMTPHDHEMMNTRDPSKMSLGQRARMEAMKRHGK